MSIDGTDCAILEPHPLDPRNFSFKLNGPGLRYEMALSIRTGMIVWVYGGKPCGSWPDLRLARHRFVHQLQPGEKAIADDGYADYDYFICSRYRPQSSVHIKRILARHETINGRLKAFAVLNSDFRHSLDMHHLCFYACATLVQVRIIRGDYLYEVDHNVA